MHRQVVKSLTLLYTQPYPVLQGVDLSSGVMEVGFGKEYKYLPQ
jgi:hypothetical protein